MVLLLSLAPQAFALGGSGAEHHRDVDAAGPTETFNFSLGLGPAFSLDQGGLTAFELKPSAMYRLPLQLPVTVYAGLDVGLEFSGSNGVSMFFADLLPTARATYGVAAIPQLRLYGELGLGPVFGTETFNSPFGSTSAGATAFGLRFGVGAEYWILENVAVFFEPIGYQLKTGSLSVTVGNFNQSASFTSSQWTLLFGARYGL